jgi:hypothetical protein
MGCVLLGGDVEEMVEDELMVSQFQSESSPIT